MLETLMDNASGPVSTTSLALVSLTTALVGLWVWSQQKPAKNFPPGPKGWPLLGNLLDFNTDSPTGVFIEIAKKYGDIYSVRMGQVWIVVFNSSETIKEALIKKGVEFAGRPRSYTFDLFSYGGKDIAGGQFTSTWKLHRKIAHSAFRTLATGSHELFEDIVYKTIANFDKYLKEKGEGPFDPKLAVSFVIYNFLANMCFGKSYNYDDPLLLTFMDISKKSLELGNGLAADYFPFMKYFPTGGKKKLIELREELVGLITKEFDEHRATYDGGEPKDLLEILFKTRKDMEEAGENLESITDLHMKLIVMDIFSAGTDTTIYTLHWAIGLLAEYPEVQEKIAKEVDSIVGRNRLPKMSDRGTLHYTEAALYEVFRFSSLVPFALPHATTKDVEIGGYFIPKETTVLFNIRAIHYDPKYWDEPEKFMPEHFLDESGSVRVHPEGFMPFSAGRRVCVGESLAKAELFLLFTWLFQHYNFSKVPGKEDVTVVDNMETASGNVLKPYEVMIKPRF